MSNCTLSQGDSSFISFFRRSLRRPLLLTFAYVFLTLRAITPDYHAWGPRLEVRSPVVHSASLPCTLDRCPYIPALCIQSSTLRAKLTCRTGSGLSSAFAGKFLTYLKVLSSPAHLDVSFAKRGRANISAFPIFLQIHRRFAGNVL